MNKSSPGIAGTDYIITQKYFYDINTTKGGANVFQKSVLHTADYRKEDKKPLISGAYYSDNRVDSRYIHTSDGK